MPVLEKTIEDFVVWWAKEHKFLTPKVKFSEVGWPDRLFISPFGHTIFIEFKVPGEKPDPLQEYRLEQLRQRGITATWCDTTHEAIAILKAALESSSVSGESHTADVVPIRSGVVPGPGAGEDQHLSSSAEDSILQGLSEALSGHRSTPAHVQGLAGRDKEVGGIQHDDLRRTPRDPEGDGPNYELAD